MMMTTVKTIRVMLVDDHESIRQGLSVFLQAFDDLELVGEASNGQEALERCEEFKPDIILMDIVMPEMDGIEATRIIRERHPDIQVVALTSYKDNEQIKKSLEAGAYDYLFKDVSITHLATTIRAACTLT